jgi:hypothetical protein
MDIRVVLERSSPGNFVDERETTLLATWLNCGIFPTGIYDTLGEPVDQRPERQKLDRIILG